MADDDFTIEDALAPPEEPEATGEEPKVEETPPETPEAEAEETPAVESVEEPETPSEETVEEPQTVPVKALTSERDKRQQAERERDELRAQLDAQNKPPEEDPKPKTSVFDDEEKAFDERLSDADVKRHSDRYDMSQALAESDQFWGEEKVAEAVKTYKGLVESNPALAQRMFDARLPYFEMMKIVDEHEKLAEIQDPEALRAKIRAEERAKLEQEQKDRQTAGQQQREDVTPSLASGRS